MGGSRCRESGTDNLRTKTLSGFSLVVIAIFFEATGDLALPVQVADLVGQQEPIHRDVVKAARDPSGLLSGDAPKDQALLIGVVQETSELGMRAYTRRPGSAARTEGTCSRY